MPEVRILNEEERRLWAYRRAGEFFYFWARKFYAKFYSPVLPGAALTGNQLIVLSVIGLKGRLTVSEVAEELGVSLSAITGVTDRLVRQGQVVRQRDAADRRLVYLELTRAGEKTVENFLRGRRELMSRCFDRLPLTEVEQIVAALDRLMTIIREDNC